MDDALFHGNIVNSRRILYTPSAFARSNLLHLQELGSLTAQRPHVSRRENLASCLFFLVEDMISLYLNLAMMCLLLALV